MVDSITTVGINLFPGWQGGETMKCKRCGEPEDRIHGCCSVYCSDMWEHEETIKELKAEIGVWREDYALLQQENARLRDKLLLIYGVAGNKANPEADKAVIRGIVRDILHLEVE